MFFYAEKQPDFDLQKGIPETKSLGKRMIKKVFLKKFLLRLMKSIRIFQVILRATAIERMKASRIIKKCDFLHRNLDGKKP